MVIFRKRRTRQASRVGERRAARRHRRVVGRVFLDVGLIACAVVLFLFVREAATSQVLGHREARDSESRLGPRVRPSERTAV